ncbi:hypothetical protein AB0H60_16285 [Nocardia rhamnosiphila]|uniref:hypothetical protein n=1 Tax=Nocardia rhamnosiphila TaxID=426716 RepID=UPI0033F17A64
MSETVSGVMATLIQRLDRADGPAAAAAGEHLTDAGRHLFMVTGHGLRDHPTAGRWFGYFRFLTGLPRPRGEDLAADCHALW